MLLTTIYSHFIPLIFIMQTLSRQAFFSLLLSLFTLVTWAKPQQVHPDSIPFLEGWSKARVVQIAKGNRPNPSTYLPSTYIEQHLKEFKEFGASYLVPKAVLDRFGRDRLGRADGQFAMTGKQMTEILEKAGYSISKLEEALGIPAGAWAGKEIVRIDVAMPQELNLRLPNGNEAGANDLWIPGGLLPSGMKEAVLDPIPKGKYRETLLQLKP